MYIVLSQPKVLGVPCSAMTTGYVGYPRHEGTRAANELLRRVMHGLSKFRRLVEVWDAGKLGVGSVRPMKNVYFIVSRYLVFPAAP